MSMKKLGAVLVAVLALTAIVVSSASAAVVTERAEWYTGAAPGTTLKEKEDVPVTLELPKETTATLVGNVAGTPVELSSNLISCVGCNITNEAVTEKAGAAAIAKGKITFSNVKVTKPANCDAQGINADGTLEEVEMITTRPLVVHADFMDKESPANSHAFAEFRPQSGGVFAGVKLTGPACGVAGNFNVTGTIFGESANDTGIQAAEQKVSFNAGVQTTTGAGLKFGANAATLTGSAIVKAGGTLFGIH
jgi:hypothetical protein